MNRSGPSSQAALAIFDVDGTFVSGDSFKWFCFFLARAGRLRRESLGRFMRDGLSYATGHLDAGAFKETCLNLFLPGSEEAALKRLSRGFLEQTMAKRVRPKALERLRWHRMQKHKVVFLSASPDIYLAGLQSAFRVDDLICTRFLNPDGAFTGKLLSMNCKGEEKRRRLLSEYVSSAVDWQQSFGYGDSGEDIPFLEMVGQPVAVNPDRKLRRVAQDRGWKIEKWQ